MDRSELFSADSDELVKSLNLLLDTLEIPIELESPLDLTPTLLLLILESSLKSRLPLPARLREDHSPQSQVEAVKMFLGVLGNDVLREDLSAIDPRRVAQGEWEEIKYVGKLLLLVAKRVGLLGVDEIVDLDPNQSFSKINQGVSLLSDISSLQLQPEDTSIFSSPLASDHPLHSPLPTPKQTNSHYTPTKLLQPHPTPRLRSSRPNGSHIPERQSTPPLEMKKPLARLPSQSLRSRYEAPSVNASVCTCTLDLDETKTTMHCHCDVHDSHVESGYFYESTLVQQGRYQVPMSHSRRLLERYHA